MKIVHLISNKSWGGGEQYVFDLCRELMHDGYEVQLLVRPIPEIINRVQELGATIKPMTWKNMVNVDADIIHVHNFKDARRMVFAKLFSSHKPRIIVTRHLIRPAKIGLFHTWIYKHVEKIIFVSDLAKKVFLATYPDIQSNKLTVVRNSIHPSPIEGTVLDLRKDLPENTTILMFHGRIAEEKGLDILLKALHEIKNLPLHLYIIGSEDKKYLSALKEEARQLNIEDKITYMGFQHSVLEFIKQADIGIIPTIVQEGCGLSCMEYMMAGKCIITTNNGAQYEYIKNNQTGLLVEPNDKDSLADAIRYAIKEKDRLGNNAKDFFYMELSYDNFYTKIKNIYGE